MVLRPCETPTSVNTCVPAWDAVARTQKQPNAAWWLIAQPDHADLAGDLAERIAWTYFPALDAEIVDGIRLHDEGWAEFDATPSTQHGRPLSFLDFHPVDFLKAWRVSIARAEESSVIGSLLVSCHFRRLAEFRLGLSGDTPEDRLLINEFLRQESECELQRTAQQNRSRDQIATLVDALQFCDLLSLYLCAGSHDEVEFPQSFHGHTVRAKYENGLWRTSPSLFSDGVSLGVTARKFPSSNESTILPILLA